MTDLPTLTRAADAVCLAAHLTDAPAIRALLGPLPWPGTVAEAVERYGSETVALVVWQAIWAGGAFAPVWRGYLAGTVPVVVRRATMGDEERVPAAPTIDEGDCLGCQ